MTRPPILRWYAKLVLLSILVSLPPVPFVYGADRRVWVLTLWLGVLGVAYVAWLNWFFRRAIRASGSKPPNFLEDVPWLTVRLKQTALLTILAAIVTVAVDVGWRRRFMADALVILLGGFAQLALVHVVRRTHRASGEGRRERA